MRTLLRIALPLVLLWGCSREMTWPLVERMIDTRYPDVQTITTDSLASLFDEGSVPLLLDVRTEEEYAVSHLEGAVRVDPEEHELSDVFDSLATNAPIITYCSVGYRSADLAHRLQEAGFTKVANLRGSIFRWANEGRPVYRDGARASEVHPYDGIWGRLLKRELRSTEAQMRRE